MNIVKATISHNYFKEHLFKPFSVSVDSCDVALGETACGDTVSIDISGWKGEDKALSILFKIFDLFFIYTGNVPEIQSIEANTVIIDKEELVYNSFHKGKFGRLLSTCEIDADSINEKTIHRLDRIEYKQPLRSLEYLFSANYDKINIVHRLTLLLQAMEGIVSDADRAGILNEAHMLTQNAGGLGEHLPSVCVICKESFFDYDQKYGCEILKLLGVSPGEFLERTTDTRNWYSHFLNEDREQKKFKKKNPLTNGSEMLYYIEILFFASRVFLCKQMGVTTNETNIQESYNRIHDWIMETKYHREDGYKTWQFQLRNAISRMHTANEQLEQPNQ